MFNVRRCCLMGMTGIFLLSVQILIVPTTECFNLGRKICPERNRKNMLDIKTIKENLEENPFCYTNGILLEMSNICNYSNLHTRCPLHFMKEKKTMPLFRIENILRELGKLKYKGIIYPFSYSEPISDPRLYLVLDLIRREVPDAKVWTYTNGFNVTDTIVEELSDRGVRRLVFSAYTQEENVRIHKMILRTRDKLPIVLRAYARYPMSEKMNDKIFWYDREPFNLTRSCHAPLKYININCDGKVILCCHDWKGKQVLGDLSKSSLKEIITSDKTIQMYVDLMQGKREKYFLCARCDKWR